MQSQRFLTTEKHIDIMKRIFVFIACSFFFLAGMAQLKSPLLVVVGELENYKYVYVIPTGGVTSSAGTSGAVFGSQYGVYGGVYGGPTRTVNPAETIKGYMMQMGYTVLPEVTPEFADKTMIVAYGYTGKRQLSPFAYASGVMIQMRDAKTQNLVASVEAEGCGTDEADDILQAIHTAIERLQYYRNPKIEVELVEEYRKSLLFSFTNKTPYAIGNIVMVLRYYLDGEMVYEQEETIQRAMVPNDEINVYIKRSKEARGKNMQYRCAIVSYK